MQDTPESMFWIENVPPPPLSVPPLDFVSIGDTRLPPLPRPHTESSSAFHPVWSMLAFVLDDPTLQRPDYRLVRAPKSGRRGRARHAYFVSS